MQLQFKRIARPVKLSVVAALCIGASSAQTIELSPGQWTVNHTLSSPSGGGTKKDQSSFCLTEASSTITFDQVLAELNWAQCTADNLVLTQSTGRANLTCTYPEYGNARLTGTMEATYSKEAYRVNARIDQNGTTYVGVARRTGPC